MTIAEFSVARPVAVTMRVASIVLLGAICATRLPIDLLPRISLPTVSVNVTWPNVAPEQMETQITRPIEQAISSAPGINQVSSSSTLGSSNVRIQFNWGTDIGRAAVDVLQLVQRAKRSLPNDPNISEPAVFKFDPSSLPILQFAVTGIDDPIKLRTLLDNEITPILESADGVASATVSGGLQRAIMVDVDPTKLQAYGLSFSSIISRISQENLDVPAGIARQGNTEYTIRAVGYLGSPAQLAKIPIATVNGQTVLLDKVAKVTDSNQDVRIQTRMNGKPAVGIQIVKQSESNTISTADAVREKLKQISKSYPELKFQTVYDQSSFIQNSIDDLKNTALIGGVLAVIVLLFFLRSIRSTLVVALSIPISIVSTFALMYFGGFTLNTISLSGLALASGLIVDDAVVVLENIFRHIERDKKKAASAAVSGASEIQSAVIASTLTVMIVFMPLLLIQGQSGQMFTQFALVVIFSMAISLLDATTLVPTLASRLIDEQEVEEEAHPELRALHGKKSTPLTVAFDWFGRKFNALDESYRRSLEWAIHHRMTVIVGAIGVTLVSLVLVPFIGTEMLPQTDSGDISVNVKMPIGTAYAVTNDTMKEIEKRILKNPNVDVFFSAAGTNLSIRGTSTTPVSYYGGGQIHLKADRKLDTNAVIRSIQRDLNSIPGARVNLTPYDLVNQILTGGASNMEVDVFGADNQAVFAKSKEVMDAMAKVPGLEAVDIGIQEAAPELRWVVDRDKANSLGVSFADIANTLNIASAGNLTTYYQEGGYQFPIYVEVPKNMRLSGDQLVNLPISTAVKNPNGTPILLGQVAKPVPAFGPSEVTRLDRRRYVAVSGRLAGRSASEVQADVGKAMDSLQWPEGMSWDYGANQKRQGQEFSGLSLTLFLAIALIYMLLASQFESFVYPLVVLMSVPLCAVGVILALFLSGRAFGLTAFIGLLMLVGIVVKNGILLVDYTTQLRGRGMPRDEAVLTASPTRLRPILMTTSAAVLGMFPLALALGKGSETQAPLATAVIGGLITSTMLTLFVVPVVYTLFDDLLRKIQGDTKDLAPSTVVGPSVSALPKAEIEEEPIA